MRIHVQDHGCWNRLDKLGLMGQNLHHRLTICASIINDVMIQDFFRSYVFCTYLEHHIHPWKYPDDVPWWERDMEEEPDLAC